jgi:hypothetical protein
VVVTARVSSYPEALIPPDKKESRPWVFCAICNTG